MNKIIIYIVLIIGTVAINAQTKLPSFFGDNMVLQQNDTVNIWGNDTPKTQITVTAGWGKEVSTKTDKNGKWRVKIATLKADKKPYMLTVKGSEEIIFNNVVFG